MLQKQRIINEFQKLVSKDSESFCERQIADYLKEKLETFGFTVSEDDAGEEIYIELRRAPIVLQRITY